MKFKLQQNLIKNQAAITGGFGMDTTNELHKSLKGIDNAPMNSWEPIMPPKMALLEKVDVHDIVTDIMCGGDRRVSQIEPTMTERPHVQTTTAPRVSEFKSQTKGRSR